jgi:hypothetical protein
MKGNPTPAEPINQEKSPDQGKISIIWYQVGTYIKFLTISDLPSLTILIVRLTIFYAFSRSHN